MRTRVRRRPLLVRPRSATTLALVLGLVVMGSGGARADDRETTRQKQQEVQAQLALAKATDDGVEAELGRLNQAVAAQQARAEAAHQAQVVAQAGVQDATARLAAIDTRVQGLRQDLARRAVQAYTDPASQGGLVAISRAATFDEASRRKALLDLVQTSTTGAVESLRGTRQDQDEATKALQAAEKLVRRRAADEADRTKTLKATQTAQQVTHNELAKRIASLMAESAELNSHQAELEGLIRQRSAPVAPTSDGAPIAPGAQVGSGPASSAGMIWPLHGPVTTEFGARSSGHPGIDIAAPNGTPIAAAKAGTVVFSGPNDGYGNYVCIDHGGGISTCYAHQSRIAVSEGQTVAQGETVGLEGSTGNSTGPHLHFEVRVNGAVQNPRNYETGNP